MEVEGRLLFFAYNGILTLLRGVVWIYRILAGPSSSESEEWGQRLGRVIRTSEEANTSPLWIQAASVGEVHAASPLLFAFKREIPGLSCHLTTTTRTGQAVARRLLDGRASLGYFPLDFQDSVRRALSALRPSALLLVETEIWPNLLAETGRRGIPVLIVNGRLSDRAFRRCRLAAPLFSRALRHVSLACVQTPLDRERFERLGLAPGRIRVTGNLKFAGPSHDHDPAPLLAALGVSRDDELWLGASTAEGEEEALLAAFLKLPPHPTARRLLVIAPRRPERFDAVAALLRATGIPWRRRTAPGDERARLILLDTLGELPLLYPAAAVAFVGGTLAALGGHNIIEPAASGVAPIFGPNVQNVRETAALLLDAGGAFQVQDAAALAGLFQRLASDPDLRRRSGQAALLLVRENARAVDVTVREILPLLSERMTPPR